MAAVAVVVACLVESVGSRAQHHGMNPSSNRVGLSAWEEIACEEKWDNAAQSVVPRCGLWMDVGAEAVAALVAAAAAPGRSRMLWGCGWVLVAYPEQRGSGGTSNDKKQSLMQGTAEKRHGRRQQLSR